MALYEVAEINSRLNLNSYMQKRPPRIVCVFLSLSVHVVVVISSYNNKTQHEIDFSLNATVLVKFFCQEEKYNTLTLKHSEKTIRNPIFLNLVISRKKDW